MHIAVISIVGLSATSFLVWCLCEFTGERRRHEICCWSLISIEPGTVVSLETHDEAPSSLVMPRRRFEDSDRGRRKIAAALMGAVILTGANAQAQAPTSLDSEIQQLRDLVFKLQARVDQLEKSQAGHDRQEAAPTGQNPQVSATGSGALTQEDRATLEFLRGTTINGSLDGYYGYNFNQPVGRVNLLRAYDVSSNSFSLNQANLIIERATDIDSGRRFGVRFDFQYGQATETLQGSAANELRPQVYRPLWQAYGTYVFPLGSGLTVDFGKWASALGSENNYGKDQINYSRSYLFNFLPFYHMGFRAGYNLSPKVNLTYWLVNGTQQTEDFNGFKSQAIILTIKPRGTISWNVNYYFGQEQRDVVAVLNPGLPAGPAQPGLPVSNIHPVPDGREHIFDSYLTWNATPRLTFVAEADYVINRVFSSSASQHVAGSAAYARYQVTPRNAMAARGEYLSDRGGLFSGVTQALKETTLTYEYKFTEGFLARAEWRRDFSNHPFFLTESPNALKKEQNTATLGLIWWFGQKQSSW